MGIRAAIQSTVITSPEQRAHMQVSSSDHCERTILSTVPIFAKGEINEECLRHNVQCWELKSWSFPGTWNPVSLGCWCLSLRDRLPPSQLMAIKAVDSDMSCLRVSYHLLVQCGNDLPMRAMTQLFHDFLVRWVQQLEWQSSSVMRRNHSPKQFCPRASCFICEYGKTEKYPQVNVHHIYPACSTLDRIQGTNAGVNQWPLWDCETTKGQNNKECLFAMLMTEKAWVLQTPQTLCPEDSRVLMLPCDDPLWLRFRFAARMSTACCSARISQQKYDIVQSFRSLLSFKSSRGISATSGWMEVAGLKLLGVAAAIRRFGRCRTAKSKQHLRHKQRMKIHPEWNQRSLSHGAI